MRSIAAGSLLRTRAQRFGRALVALCALAPCARAAEDLTFDTIGTGAGLPHQNVTAIVQDARGYLWIGTGSGVARYDGFQFRTYLADETFRALSIDRDGNLWAGSVGGLDRYIPQTDSWQHYNLDDAHTPPHARRVVWQILDNPDCRGGGHALWIASSDGLKRLDYDTGQTTTFRNDPRDPASLAVDRTYALASDAQCRLWVGTGLGVQYLARDATRFSTFPTLTDASGKPARVDALLVDSSQTLWIASQAERSAWDVSAASLAQPRARFVHNGGAEDAVQHLAEDHRHNVWAATPREGLQLWDRERGLIHSYLPDAQDPRALASRVLNWVFEGRDQTLWVGTFDHGLVRSDLGTHGFVRYTHSDADPASLAHENAGYVVGEVDGAALWIGSPGGLSRMDARSGRATRFHHADGDPRSLANDDIGGIAIDANRTVWIASEGGIDAFEPATQTFRHLALSAPIVKINLLACDERGQLWLGTNSGVFRVDPGTGKVSPAGLNSAADGGPLRVTALQFESSAVWVGTDTSLVRLDAGGQPPVFFQHQDGVSGALSSDRISAFARDRDGRLWIGTTTGGLNRLDRQPDGSVRFHAYTQREGLVSNSSSAILEDHHGRLWISSPAGLSVFDPAQESFRRYAVADGLLEHGYYSRSAWAAPDGTLYFGGVHGLTAFRPDEISTNAEPPLAAINAVDILDRRRAQPEHLDRSAAAGAPAPLDLAYTTAVLTFDLAALHFADPARNRLRYRLANFDVAWHERDASQHTVTYTNLDPGEYTFSVQAASKNGIWSEPVALALTIRPPFWETGWFRLLALALLVAAVTAAYRLRIAGLKARQRVLEGEVAARTAELRQASAYKSEFLANMSHEIRTPMNAVLGLLHLSLRERGLGERVRSYLGKIHVSAVALLRIIDDILDTSKIEAGRLELERVGFLLDDIVSHVLTVTEQKAAERGLALQFEIAPACPRELLGDPLRLGQVLINLINNAIKFTERGAVTARCELERAEGDTVRLRWSVRDTGIGMTREQLDRLFQPFVQADASITRKYGGTGLGLSISRRLVELMGGRLEATSEPGVGTVFTWTLAFAPAPPGTVRSAAAAVAAPAHSYAAANVLLVEDNAINQLIAQELMRGAGLAVDVADSGDAALRCVRAQAPGHYAVVLMDLQMPGMDGFAATHALRELPVGGDLPVIALTAHASPEIQRRCSAAGMQGCLSKPFHPAQLFALLDRFIPARERAAPSAAAALPREPAAAPLFEPQRGLASVDRNETLYRTVLRRFLAQTPATLHDLARALELHERVPASRIAHTLRGLAATIGALTLADCAARLERRLEADEPDWAAARYLAEELATLAESTCGEVSDYVENLPLPVTIAAAVPIARDEYLATLRRLLAGSSGRTMTWVEQGREHLRAELGPARTREFEQAIAAFDFARALRVLNARD